MKAKNNKNTLPSTPSACTAANCLPTDEASLRILQQRAEQLKTPALNQFDLPSSATYIKFALGPADKYGIDFKYIKEIINDFTITNIPCAGRSVVGIINRRGNLISVVDLQHLLYGQTYDLATINDKNKNIIIIHVANTTVGILADYIEGSIPYDPEALDPAIPSESLTKAEFISGLHQGQVALINIDTVINNAISQITTCNN